MDTSPKDPNITSVLFVCLGNICRSPLAEGVFKELLREEGLSDRFEVDSAGTGAWHVGEAPDSRAAMVASRHGVELESRARQVTPEDLRTFDYILAMDHDNLRNLERMGDAEDGTAEIRLFREFDAEGTGEDVPDPYYGGPSGFENVYQMVRSSSQGLLQHLRAASPY